MYSVTKKFSFCYGHRLLNYAGKCKNLHGHNGLVEISVDKEALDDLGMVVDFGDIKDAAKKWVDDTLDHRLILNEDDPIIPDMEKHAQPFVTVKGNPTAEAIARYIFEHCREVGLPVRGVRLWETSDSCADYQG
jgi:6-pyruvoyltetrahydropterin/6-carboxytetrahydropterin synthase